jgi:protein tyrosine/serine phosphatase
MSNAVAKRESREKGGRSTHYAKWFVGLAIPLAVSMAAASPFLGSLGDNFHAVIHHCVYRSGQLSPESLEDCIAYRGIRSIINLRGANPGDDWYDQECAVARNYSLRFYDLPVDSQCPTPPELKQLLGVLEACPKPVLIHCQSGIDRSGIVAAICVLLLDDSGSIGQAREHLGWRYGHMPWCDNFSRQEKFLDDYQKWLTASGRSHSRCLFHRWLLIVSGQKKA